MDLPREIRDMIYVQALVSEKILLKEEEEAEQDLDPRRNPRKPASTALLQVSRTLNNEANVIFYSLNTFRLSSSYSISGKPSIFNSHATLFRRVLLELFIDQTTWEQRHYISDWNPTPNLDSGIALVNIWRKQIRSLAPMINVQSLELKVLGLLDLDWGLCRRGVLKNMALEDVAAHYLKPELLAIFPSAHPRGTCITRSRHLCHARAQQVCFG